jgi:hypothetical protein
MARNKLDDKVNDLFHRGEWEAARTVLERERERDPDNHWVLTQLGVTLYEQRRYREALKLFLASLKIVPDCPLALWNLAATLDALGRSADAVRIYTWLLQSDKTPEEDPCWESKEWTEALKADCVYRLGVCFRHLGKRRKAENCYRQYLTLLSIGIDGTYSIDDVRDEIRALNGVLKNGGPASELRKVVNSTLQASGIGPRKGPRKALPDLDDLRVLVTGRRAASKR